MQEMLGEMGIMKAGSSANGKSMEGAKDAMLAQFEGLKQMMRDMGPDAEKVTKDKSMNDMLQQFSGVVGREKGK